MQNKSLKILFLTISSLFGHYIHTSQSQIANALELANAVYEYQYQQQFPNNAYVVLDNLVAQYLNMSINLSDGTTIPLFSAGIPKAPMYRLGTHILNAINSSQTGTLNINVTSSGKKYNIIFTFTNNSNNKTHQYTHSINELPSSVTVTMQTAKNNKRTVPLVPTSIGVSEYNFVLVAPNSVSAVSPLSFSTAGTLNPWILGINYTFQTKNYNVANSPHYAFVQDLVNGTPSNFANGEGIAANISQDLMTKLSKHNNVSMSILAFDVNGNYISSLKGSQPAYMSLSLFDSQGRLIVDPIVFSAANMINESGFTTNDLVLNSYDSNGNIQKPTILPYPFLVQNVTKSQVSIYSTLTDLQKAITLNTQSMPYDNDFALDTDFKFNIGNYCFIENTWTDSTSFLTAIKPGTIEYSNLIDKLRTETTVSLVMLGYDNKNNLITSFSSLNNAVTYSLFAYDTQGNIIEGFPVSFSANSYYTSSGVAGNGFNTTNIPFGGIGLSSNVYLTYPFLLQIDLGLSQTDMNSAVILNNVKTKFWISPKTANNNFTEFLLYNSKGKVNTIIPTIKSIIENERELYVKTHIQVDTNGHVNQGVVKLYDNSGNLLKLTNNTPISIYFAWSIANKNGVPSYYSNYKAMQKDLGQVGETLEDVLGGMISYTIDSGVTQGYVLDGNGVHIVKVIY